MAGQEARDREILVQVWPVQIRAIPCDFNMIALFRSAMPQAGYQARGTMMLRPSRRSTLSSRAITNRLPLFSNGDCLFSGSLYVYSFTS